ncbi:hypothetical protein D3C80_2098050 [compost metagenome]
MHLEVGASIIKMQFYQSGRLSIWKAGSAGRRSEEVLRLDIVRWSVAVVSSTGFTDIDTCRCGSALRDFF